MTDIALREYLERRIADLERRIDDRFAWNDDAVNEAKQAIKERLNSMNEFRDALRDQAGRMATRVELERLDQTVQELQRAKANFDGRLLVTASLVSIVISAVATLLMRMLRP